MELFWGGGKLKLVNSLLIPVFFFSVLQKQDGNEDDSKGICAADMWYSPKGKSIPCALLIIVMWIIFLPLIIVFAVSFFFCGMLLQRVWPAFICVVVQKVEDTGEMNTCWKFNRTSVHLWTALVSDLSFQGYMTFFACDVRMYDICRPQTADCKLFSLIVI